MTQLVVHELEPIRLTTKKATATGLIAVTMERVPAGQALLIDRANCYSDSTTATMLDLYDGDISVPTNRISGSSSGNRDEADFPLGLQIGPTRQLTAVWSNASLGAIGSLRLQVRRVLGEN